MKRWPGDPQRETTSFGGLSRGELMSRVRSTGNKTTEERFVRLLRRAQAKGWRRHLRLPGRPDFAWRKIKLAVFLDGCFWHGHRCRNLTPRTNAAAWNQKIRANQARDRKNNKALKERGWTVIRIWECQLANRPEECMRNINRVLTSAPPGDAYGRRRRPDRAWSVRST